jgi:hypothetical protein
VGVVAALGRERESGALDPVGKIPAATEKTARAARIVDGTMKAFPIHLPELVNSDEYCIVSAKIQDFPHCTYSYLLSNLK